MRTVSNSAHSNNLKPIKILQPIKLGQFNKTRFLLAAMCVGSEVAA